MDCSWSRARELPTCEDILEGQLNVAGVKGGCFDEREVVLACQRVSTGAPPLIPRVSTRTGKLLGLLGGDRTEVSQIALVTDQHDHDIGVGVVSQLLQPPVDIVVGLVLADVVDEEGTDGATVVGRGDGPVALLTSSIPDLCLDGLGVDLDRASRKLHADGGLGV